MNKLLNRINLKRKPLCEIKEILALDLILSLFVIFVIVLEYIPCKAVLGCQNTILYFYFETELLIVLLMFLIYWLMKPQMKHRK